MASEHGLEDAIDRVRAWTAATYAIGQLPGLTIHFVTAAEAMEIVSTSRWTLADEAWFERARALASHLDPLAAATVTHDRGSVEVEVEYDDATFIRYQADEIDGEPQRLDDFRLLRTGDVTVEFQPMLPANSIVLEEGRV